MRLYVIAYPELSDADLAMIQDCRKVEDRLYGMVDPHFTLVFMVDDMPVNEFREEIKKQVAGAKAFPFTIRCTTINKDTFSNNYFAFLVPDEGFSNIVKLHDKLYDDKLFPHRRLDIDYIPHILIATSPDKMKIKGIVDEWNAKDIQISGSVSAIQVISFERGVLDVIETIPLEATTTP